MPLTEFSESLCSKNRGETSRNALDLVFSVQSLTKNSVAGLCRTEGISPGVQRFLAGVYPSDIGGYSEAAH